MNRYYSKSAVTLMELLVALSLLGLLVVGISSLNTYAQYHLITSDRRAQVQNELSLVLEYMSRDIARATGDSNNPGIALVGGTGPAFQIRVDNNTPPTAHNYGDDDSIEYSYTPAPSKIQRTITFTAGGQNIEVLNTRDVILDPTNNGFTSILLGNDTGIQVTLIGRFQPTKAASLDNPELTMQTTVYSRSASSN